MTDIANAAPITFRPWFSLRVQFPKWTVGSALANSSESIRRAFEMAYVAPFCSSQPKPLTGPDEELEGRNPNW